MKIYTVRYHPLIRLRSILKFLFWELPFEILTCEFFLRFMPNGGKAVLLRAALISFTMYTLGVWVIVRFGSSSSKVTFWAETANKIPWLGAIFWGIYVALYSRFSSQWSYLANLYNQQICSLLTLPDKRLSRDNYDKWEAAFIEDAVCMHLDTKEGFSNVVYMMLQDYKVKNHLKSDAFFGEKKVDKLIKKLEKIKNKIEA